MTKRILITGAAGFIGSHLAEALLQRGDRVVGVDNFNTYYEPVLKEQNVTAALQSGQYRLKRADICDEALLRTIFEEERPDTVVHLAARAGVRPSLLDPNLYHRVNVIGSQHILDACRDFGVTQLVFASSSSVYGSTGVIPFREDDLTIQPISPYGATKRMNELQCHVYHHLYGLNVTLLRFFTVYGPRQRPDMAVHKFTRAILEGKAIPFYGTGETRRDYTYVDDIVHGIVCAIDRPSPYALYNLGESRTTTLAELVALLEKHLGRTATLDRQPLQPGDVTETYADISRARADLGYYPKFSMDEGIRRFVAWYRGQHG
jgi:UDP-glucuronate 4-epimerase